MLYVDNQPFLGRVEEQKQFRAALSELLHGNADSLPYVFLLYGDGGIGKTTLARRYRDIALGENPFKGKFNLLWVDWESERDRHIALNVGSLSIRPDTVFDVLYTCALRENWQEHFVTYHKALEDRKQAEKRAAEIIMGSSERPELAAIRGAGAGAIAKILRAGLPVIGESGENLAKAFLGAGIQVAAEQAAQLRTAIETRLRGGLQPAQYELFVNSIEGLARALASGLQSLAQKRRLLVVLDTYEIVDRADPWLRQVILNAGPTVTWVISGRNDLYKSRGYGEGYFRGYNEVFPRRLLPYDMAQLALEDVRSYFASSVPQRLLDDAQAESLRRATRGIPLAIKQASEMWERGASLADIVGDTDDATPGREIVGKMTARYLLHAIGERQEDKYALFALALARGNVEILRAMLRPEGEQAFDLSALLARLERDYASVHKENCRLHDEPELFFEHYLRREEMRGDDRIQAFNQRAADHLCARLATLEERLPLLEERCEDEDWLRGALNLQHYLLWLNEDQAWRWFAPRFVESLAYSRELRNGLLRIFEPWKEYLSKRGQKWLKVFTKGVGYKQVWLFDEDGESVQEMLTELGNWQRLGSLSGENESEHSAIIAWLRGRWLTTQKRYEEAIAAFETAAMALPPDGEQLRKQLANYQNSLARKLLWPDGPKTLNHHPKTLKLLTQVTTLMPENKFGWYQFGVVLNNNSDREKAIVAYQQAIQLDPKWAHPYNGLGNIYRDLNRHKEAIIAFQKALQIDPRNAYAHIGLGTVFRALERYEDAILAYQKAIQFDPRNVYAHIGLGALYHALEQYEDAISSYQQASQIDATDPYPYAALGATHYALGQYEDAIFAIQQSIQLNPTDTYPYKALGYVYQVLEQHENSIDAYKKAIQLSPTDAYSYIWLGRIYTLKGEYENAHIAYQKAVELEPNRGMYRNLLASILIRMSNVKEANEQIAFARQFMFKEDEYNRACFESICCNTEEALTLLKTAIEKHQTNLEWARQDPNFDNIRDDPRFRTLVGLE